MKIRAELFQANGQAGRQTDRRGEANRLLSLFCENCVSCSLRHTTNLTFIIIIIITTTIIIVIKVELDLNTFASHVEILLTF